MKKLRQNENKITPHKIIDTKRLTNKGLDKYITTKEVRAAIKSFKQRAPGHSGITAEHMKRLPDSMLHEIAHLYNSILCTGYIPAIFKFAIIIMIPKPGKSKKLATNYRPI